QPACSAIASSIAQVEPLPLVPATVITGQANRSPMRSATARTRSRPSSIVFGCSRSQYASHSSSESMPRLSQHRAAIISRMGITLYGITNCDTVKKARAWLAGAGVDYVFHDFKKQGVPGNELDRWIAAVGWDKLVNRQGTTWRKL